MKGSIRKYVTFSNLFWLVAFAVFFYGCKQKGNFSISGRITNAEGKMIYLEKLNVGSSTPVDSVKIEDDGTFEFVNNVSMPEFFLLKLNDNNFITLLADSADNIMVAGDRANFSREYIVAGSEGSELVRDLTLQLQETTHKLDSLSSLQIIYKDKPGYNGQIKKWIEEYDTTVKEQVDFSLKFVLDHPFSMASVLALYQKFDEQNYVVQDLQSLKTAASALKSIYPNSEHVNALYSNTLNLIKKERNIKLRQFMDQAAENSPDIDLPDVNGKSKKLSSLRGKYVLLQFWSAKDRNSRIQNPVLVANYKKFRRKGFEIYQVCVDEERSEWVDAVDRDKLTWTNVNDLKGCFDAVTKYNIKKIPMNYLLDKEGRIVAKDLKGPVIGQTLSKIFE